MPSSTAPSPAQFSTVSPAAPWWARNGLGYDEAGRLCIDGEPAIELSRRAGTPAYFYSATRITENVNRLRAALTGIAGSTGPAPRLLYAMKSNRFAPVLKHLRSLGVGLDVCSPGEVRHALACGFTPGEMSFTSGSLSTADYTALAQWPALWINADSLTALRRIAEVSPSRTLGLRINPATGLGYTDNPLLRYAGIKPTKFGVYLDRFAEALELSHKLGLSITTLHCHAGCGFLTPQLPTLDEVFSRIDAFLKLAPGTTRLNLGGGLGIPLTAADAPLDLNAWAALVRAHFGSRNLALEFEPGDYLVKDSGVLLTEITQVEEKGGRVFVGLNAGFNIHPEPAFYKLPLAPVPALRRDGPVQTVTLAGNINEALDLWAEDTELPPLAEGDVLCLLNAGGYGASMSSAHCLRSDFTEHLLSGAPQEERQAAMGTESLSESNQQAWDKLYGSTPDLVWGSAPLPFITDFIDDFRRVMRSPSRLLDAGTGEGRNLGQLLRCGADELHALDSSARALEKIPAAIRARIDCHRADLSATGLPDAHFDGITLLDTIETLPNGAAVLSELFRVLKPGGVLLCNIPGLDDGVAGIDMQAVGQNAFLYRQSYYFQFIERHEAEAFLCRAGFEVLRSCRCRWQEASHPGFRDQEHQHISQIFLVRKPDISG